MVYDIKVIKKDGTLQDFKIEKVIVAANKSAYRAMRELNAEETLYLEELVEKELENKNIWEKEESGVGYVTVPTMHNIVEKALEQISSTIAKSYRDYRDYKTSFVAILDSVYKKSQSIMYIGDKENSNSDSALVSTKRCLIFGQLNKELYQKFFMTTKMLQACNDGYIYTHDMSSRRDCFNCCLFDVESVLNGGFEMGNIWYNEPKSLDVAFDVIGDVILSSASQQYGGFTVSRIDEILSKYAKLSFERYKNDYVEKHLRTTENVLSTLGYTSHDDVYHSFKNKLEEEAEKDAWEKIRVDFRQGFQGLEYKLNTVASSRGDYPFTTLTISGIGDEFSRLAAEMCLEVRKQGQGAPGHKKAVLFPKIVFTYTKDLHGEGKELEYLFDKAIDCSLKSAYPDYLSLDGDTTVAEMYHKYGEIIAPMGCVDGAEVVTYKIDDRLYVEGIERMWKRLSSIYKVKEQKKGDPHLYLDTDNEITVYDKEKGFVPVKRMVKNFSTNWVMLKMSNGRSLKCTSDHPLPVIGKGRTFVKDLEVGDTIPLNKGQYTENNFNIDVDTAWMLGVFLCDGCYDKQATVSIALTGEDEIQNKLEIVMKNKFNSSMTYKERHRGKKGDYKDLRFTNQSKISKELINAFEGLQKKYRHVPNFIFSCDEELRLAFLAGMIDADGFINSNNHVSRIQIGSTNKELAIQQMLLMQSLGARGCIYPNHYKSGSKKIRYRVECDFIPGLEKYIQCEKKKEHIKDTYRVNANASDFDVATVTSVEYLDEAEFSYDLTTESDHFDVSGIYSHNCRAFLSPYYERGGMEPADENDKPFFIGRFNIGVVSLNLPMIFAKSKHEDKDFYEVLDEYLQLAREVHIKTYEYLGEMRASTNPMAFCQGGMHEGYLQPHDKIKPLLKYATASFGITALNELNRLYNGKSIREDGEFPLEVMRYINTKIAQFKKEDKILYAIYGTPAESLAGTQVTQFRKMYGIVENVSDRDYVTNSFHCHVSEEMSGIEKQDKEFRFWDLLQGGRIQYVKYDINYNKEAVKAYVTRAMDMGLYEGVNFTLCFCEDCGHSGVSLDECPKCRSKNMTRIERMNGGRK